MSRRGRRALGTLILLICAGFSPVRAASDVSGEVIRRSQAALRSASGAARFRQIVVSSSSARVGEAATSRRPSKPRATARIRDSVIV